MAGSEVAGKADFRGIRYAQCWEDADVLVEGLDVHPGDVCLSIASAGENCSDGRSVATSVLLDCGSQSRSVVGSTKSGSSA